jgi:ribosomal protein L37E
MLTFLGPKTAKRKVVCRRCGREILKGADYFVQQEGVVRVGFNPKWRVAAWRYPTVSWVQKRVICPECKAALEEEREKLRKVMKEFERKCREPEIRAKELMIQLLKAAGEPVAADRLMKHVAGRLGAEPPYTALAELVEKGVVELIRDRYPPLVKLLETQEDPAGGG